MRATKPLPTPDGDTLIHTDDAAVSLAINISTLYRYLASGLLAGRKVGGKRYVLQSSIDRLIAGETSPAAK